GARRTSAPRRAVEGYCLGDRHEIAPVLTVGLGDGSSCLRLQLADLLVELGDLGFALEDALHAGEVETFVRELLDALQSGDVGVAVPTAAPAGSCRVDKSFALVDAQGLRVHAGQLGR